MDSKLDWEAECDVPVPGIPSTGNSLFLVVSEPVSDQIGTWKKVSEPVSVEFGTDKKSRNRYRQNMVPENSLGTGIRKI